MSGALDNPAVAGLIAGIFIWVAQLVWNRTIGGPNEKSIPMNIADINVKLADISMKLELSINESKHLQKDVDQLKIDFASVKKCAASQKEFEELKQDFWDHIEKLHNGQAPGHTGQFPVFRG